MLLPQNAIGTCILSNSSPNFLQRFQFCKYSSFICGHVYIINKHLYIYIITRTYYTKTKHSKKCHFSSAARISVSCHYCDQLRLASIASYVLLVLATRGASVIAVFFFFLIFHLVPGDTASVNTKKETCRQVAYVVKNSHRLTVDYMQGKKYSK
jgi:hypothetical protein